MRRAIRALVGARWLVAVLLLALVARVVWVATIQPDPRDGRFDDSVWYYNTGRLLADGEGYVYPLDALCKLGQNREPGIDCSGDEPPTALWAPGYPLTLAAVFLLPGDDVAAARALNVAAGLVLAAAVYYLGSRLWSQRAGLLAAGIVALFPSHVFFSSLVMTETFFAALLACVLCLAVAWTAERHVGVWKLLALGLAVGALALVRPEGAGLVAVFAAVWYALHRSWRVIGRQLAPLILGMAVLFVPWTARNWIQLGTPVAGTTGFGQVLLQAHHELSDGRPDIVIVSRLWRDQQGYEFPEREIRINNAGVRDSVGYAVKHPWRELGLVPDRLGAFYQGDWGAVQWNQVKDGDDEQVLSASSSDRLSVLSDVYYYSVLGCGVFGLLFWLRRARPRHGLIFGPIALYTLLWAFVFVGEPRYHFALIPAFALLAGAGLAAASEARAARRRA